ncbi:MAG: SRPBCC family protein [Acidimicrobiales bacterium]
MAIRDERSIAAPLERVWALTVDIERWPDLTPTITSVERLDDGPLAVGSRARLVQPGQRPAVWTVTRLEAPHAFEWSTKVLGIEMVGTHHLVAEGDGCRNVLGLELHGFGAGLLARLVGGKVQQAIETENRGFQQAAEAAG